MTRRSDRRSRYNVLLIEPDSADARRFREAFDGGEVPTQVRVAPDADEALTFLADRGAEAPTPDLVLLDSQLPDMPGHDLLSALKSDPDVGFLPVIVLANSSDGEDVVETYRRQANARVQKPTDSDELEALVRSLERFWLGTVQLPTESLQ